MGKNVATLTSADRKRIDQIIDDIQIRTGFSYPERGLLDLARAEDVKVFEADLSKIRPNLMGIIEYDDDEQKKNPKIYINKNIDDQRKVFTLAHELAHHFIHEGRRFRLDTLDYSSEDKDTLEESEANYFAASLLIPKDLLLYRLEKGDSIKQLAEYFEVSLPAIKNRLRWIGTT